MADKMIPMDGSVFVVAGEPGVGKSKVAKHIAKRTDGKRLATDVIRKDLFGPEPEYTREESQAVYDEMFDRAKNFLTRGKGVVLDATFMLASGRERANRLAQKFTDPYDFTIVRVICDEDIAIRRIKEREGISDADTDVYRSIRDRFEDIELPHVTIDNSAWWFDTKRQMRDKDVYESPRYYR
jgi:predicted kinase